MIQKLDSTSRNFFHGALMIARVCTIRSGRYLWDAGRVASKSGENKMTVANLGVCFGPCLMRPEEETMASIMDIKFCNIIVELLINNYHKVMLACITSVTLGVFDV